MGFQEVYLTSTNEAEFELLVQYLRGNKDWLYEEFWVEPLYITAIKYNAIELVDKKGKKESRLVCERKFESILVPTDFSPSAERAEKIAAELAKHADKIVFASVVDEGETEEEIEELKAKAAIKLEKLGESCKATCPEVKVKIETGIPSKHIRAIAEEENTTLIVLGMRGKGGVEGLVLGSTAETVVRTSKRPVLLVPAAR